MIELQLSSKQFAGRTVLGPLSLQLRAGELVCLLGPSGCGKTTLLNILSGLDQAWSGSLNTANQRISYMFQQPRLLPWRTVRQNLALVADTEAIPRIDGLLQLMELGDIADQYPGRLSLGMARRVALARTLLNDPQLILLDEPFVSLDPPTAETLGEMLKRLRVQHPQVAVLMVTHNLREALALSDRVLVLGGQPARIVREFSPGTDGEVRDGTEEQTLLACYQQDKSVDCDERPVNPATAVG